MYPIPFTFLLLEQKDVETRYATPRLKRPEIFLAEADTRKPKRVRLDQLVQRFRPGRGRQLTDEPSLEQCRPAVSCRECQ